MLASPDKPSPRTLRRILESSLVGGQKPTCRSYPRAGQVQHGLASQAVFGRFFDLLRGVGAAGISGFFFFCLGVPLRFGSNDFLRRQLLSRPAAQRAFQKPGRGCAAETAGHRGTSVSGFQPPAATSR
jgi:hypothetical protein